MQDYHGEFDSRIYDLWIYDLQKVHPLINDTLVIHWVSYVCEMLQKIICWGETIERRFPISYLDTTNVPKSKSCIHLTSLSDLI